MMIWRLLASVQVVSDQGQRQQQTIKHEQAMNDSKNEDTLRFAKRANQFMNRDDALVWFSLAWCVALCGAAIWALFWPEYFLATVHLIIG
jgi:hypothetical protein